MIRLLWRSIVLEARSIRYIRTLPSLNAASNPSDKDSLTVSYLINSCGLSLKDAVSVSKDINIRCTEKSDAVLNLLAAHGFTQSDIVALISKNPSVILSRQQCLKPKIEYFESLGVVGSTIIQLLGSKNVFGASLKNRIMPTLDFLRRFLDSNEEFICSLKGLYLVIGSDLDKVIVPNISTLRAHGVPDSNIKFLIMSGSRALAMRPKLLNAMVGEVKKMGFEPTSRKFVVAIRCMSAISGANLETKKMLLMAFGWSEPEFLMAFRAQPMFITCSEKKMRKVINLVKKIGLEPSDVCKYPNLFLSSLERRIIPRWSVLEVLRSNGLMKKDVNVPCALISNTKYFEKNYVVDFKKHPEVIKAYRGEIGFQGFSN